MESFAKIAVIGIGGGGNSAVNRMIEAKIRGVDFISLNTDMQALHQSLAKTKLNIGKGVTRGLGAGMDPEMGRRAAEESQNEIRDVLKDKDMIFITCGLGGGTGSGAAPIVADLARDTGALVVAVVTKPFNFEGSQRKDIADRAFENLKSRVDTIITIPNDRVLHVIDKKTTLRESFRLVDDVLRQGVQGISEVITIPGEPNVDFADVRTIMRNAGSALMGIGEASGDSRAVEAAKQAISSPLLDLSIDGARGILMVIAGGESMGMQEMQEASKIITGSAHPEAKVIWGAVVDSALKDDMKITVIATGFDGERRIEPEPRAEEEYPAFGSRLYTPPSPRAILQQPLRETKVAEDYDALAPAPLRRKETVSTKLEKSPEEEELEIPTFIRRKMGGI